MKILHLEDNPRDASLVRDMLTAEWPDCFVSVVDTRKDFESHLNLGGFDLILSDYQLPGFNGLDALALARQIAPTIPFVFLSGTLGEESAIDAVRAGASDYVIKDRIQRLPMSIQRALREAGEQLRRKRVEEALAQERYLQRLLMEHLPARVYFKDLQSAFIAVSRSFATQVGTLPELMKGKSDFDLFHPDYARKAFEDEQRIIRTGEPMLNYEEKETWPDGRVMWIASSKLPLRDATGKIIGTFGISHDITARRNADEQIREQAEIMNEAPIAIMIIDLHDGISYCNKGAELMYGYKRDEIVGREEGDLFALETMDELDAGRRVTMQHGRWTGSVPVMTEKGKALQAEFHMSLIRDSAGQPRARLSISIDVTEKKKLEEQFLRAQRLESLGMLAAGIAHDLNNVLAPILMGAPLLRASDLPAADLRLIEAIETSASRGAALVRQILSFAHGAGGEQMLVQAKHLVRDVAILVKQSFPKSVRLEEEIPGDLWPVQGNPTQLHQVVLNLCVNGRDAMPNGGVLHLRAENREVSRDQAQRIPDGRPGLFLMMEVSDSGTGIPPEILKRIWEPFFTTKGEGKGTGLGLATVRGIVANHHGFITLDTEVGKGTTFRVYLPAADQSASGGNRDSAVPFMTRGTGELVLLADDEESVRDMVKAVLGRSGYRVLSASDGAEAIDLYVPRVKEVSLVITDLDMPEVGGNQLAQVLRRVNPQVKILFISGSIVAGGAVAPAGARVLPKPFTDAELIERVHQTMHESEQPL